MWELQFAGQPVFTIVSEHAARNHLAAIMELMDGGGGVYEVRGDPSDSGESVKHWLIIGPSAPVAIVQVS